MGIRGKSNTVAIWTIVAALAVLCDNADARAREERPPVNTAAGEADQAYLREHYTKYEHNIAMRDGIKLFVAVYAPKDNSKPYPMLLTRTPYSCKPYGVDRYPDPRGGPMMYYAAEKFIFVLQDVRGRYASEGTFEHMRPHKPN